MSKVTGCHQQGPDSPKKGKKSGQKRDLLNQLRCTRTRTIGISNLGQALETQKETGPLQHDEYEALGCKK